MSVPASQTLSALEAITRAEPRARKILVAPDVNWAREILFALAWRTGGWVGWEAATLRSVAEELAFADLGRTGRRVAGDVELTTLVDEALIDAVESSAVGAGFSGLSGGLGFRKAVRDALLELRIAGIGAAQVRQAATPGSPARDLAAVLEGYERRLAGARAVDPAGIFALALDAFDREAPFTLSGTLVLAPDLRSAGLPGALVARLLDLGARPLAGDQPVGLEPPARTIGAIANARAVAAWPAEASVAPSPLTWLCSGEIAPAEANFAPVDVDLFAASTPTDEIREVLRRAVAEGRTWDEIEIATTDPDTYGIALDAVCSRAGIRYSSLSGLPLARTRIGRALERWLGWIGDGLPVDMIREALEAGDLALADSPVAPGALARRLRRLGIGWGRGRYEAALERLRKGSDAPTAYDDESVEEFADRLARHRRQDTELARLIDALLRFTPPVPERGVTIPVRTSAAALARATVGWLALLPLHGDAEARTAARLRTRLDDLAATGGNIVSFGTALAELRDALADLRAWTASSEGRKPWSASGGAVHLTDLAHAGTTGRPRVFVVGLDADRAAGARVQDPFLNDAARAAIDPDALPTTAVRRAERGWTVARALARLRGRVTLSHAIAGDTGDRAVGPAHVMLQAHRLIQRDASLDYDSLRVRLGTPVCPVPANGDEALDPREVWLAAIAQDGVLLDAELPVRAHYALLDTGLLALVARKDGRLCAHHGLVVAAAGRFDPRASERPISPSSLERLATCPLAWFYHYGLRLRLPDDPAYDTERWLDPMARGSLLHRLYEQLTTEYQGRQPELLKPAARDRALALLEALLAEWRSEVPPPSEAVYATEAGELATAALTFLEAEREAVARGNYNVWEAFEVKFGSEERVTLVVGDGAIPVKGIIDRIDRTADGSLLVIDYKTGSAYAYKTKDAGPFKGGRHLQAAIYAAAAERRMNRHVSAFEYRFPTPKGENIAVRYTERDFLQTAGIIGGLLEHVTSGHFVPTNDSADCKYCDYALICRARAGEYNKVVSPRAEWAKEHGADHPEYAGMRARRGEA